MFNRRRLDPRIEWRRLLGSGWVALAAVIALVAVASVVVASLRAPSNGCLFDDGAAYCRMGMGRLATLPWSRRVAVPALVTLLPHGWSVVFRFKLVALVSSLGATIATFLLTLHLVRDRTTPRVARCAAVAAAGLVALAPHLFRMALLAPVLVDQAAIFLGVVWCLLVTSESRSVTWISPLVALLLIPTREASILPLLCAAAALWWTHERALAAATVLATLLGTVFALTRPRSTIGPFGHFSSAIQILHDGRLTLIHPDRAMWSIFFGAGFVTFLGVLLFAHRQLLRGPVGVVLAVASAHILQAPLGGTDVPRYAAEAVPYAAVLAMIAAVEIRTPRMFLALGGLTVATLLLWQPFRVPGAGGAAYLAMYTPHASSAVIAIAGLLMIVTILVWVIRDMDLPIERQSFSRVLPGHRSSDA